MGNQEILCESCGKPLKKGEPLLMLPVYCTRPECVLKRKSLDDYLRYQNAAELYRQATKRPETGTA